MYASRTTQFIVGIFGLLGIAALVYLSISLGQIGLFSTGGYLIYANFDNVSGLKTGDQVQIAGVKVGKVQAISLSENRARVAMHIEPGVKIDTEAIASIKTSGIIGDKYVAVSLGFGEHDLGEGGYLHRTESAFVLEDAIGQLINSSSSGGGAGSSKSAGGAPCAGKNASTACGETGAAAGGAAKGEDKK